MFYLSEIKKNKSKIPAIFVFLMFTLIIAGCQHKSAAAQTVEVYLDALVSKDINRVAVLICPDYEEQALMEFDALQLVSPRLDNVECFDEEMKDQVMVVKCNGSIVTSYNNEVSTINLDQRLFQVKNERGDWYICGFQ